MSRKVDPTKEKKKENVSWTESMDDEFIEEMLHQTRQGNLPNAPYKTVVANLREKL